MNSSPWCEYEPSLPAPGLTRKIWLSSWRAPIESSSMRHARLRLDRAPLFRADQSARLLRQIVEIEHRRAVGRRQPLQRRHRRVGLGQLDGAEESGRYFRALRCFDDAEVAALSQPPQFASQLGGACAVGGLCGRRLAQRLADAGEVQQLDVAQVLDPLEDVEQLRAIEAVAPVAPRRRNQADVLPQPERGRADAQDARGFAYG